jgi:CRP/FNR family transcriptional regulator, cyclic AMP receptor protein
MRKALYLMGILDDRDVEWMAKYGTTRLIPSGTVLIKEGKAIEDVFVVLEGKLTVSIQAMGQREVAALLAGEIVGEMSFVDARPPSASVIAQQDSYVLAIPRGVLTGKLKTDDAFAARFYRALATLLADRLRKTTGFLGYGKGIEETDPDELDESLIGSMSLGATRFDRLLVGHIRGANSGSKRRAGRLSNLPSALGPFRST